MRESCAWISASDRLARVCVKLDHGEEELLVGPRWFAQLRRAVLHSATGLHKIALDVASCKVYPAVLALKTYMYQLCGATPIATQ